ncbi:MAG: hypothetical protein JWQ42_565 [Edaphobacter sp.]|nr:hypothetical protein [Edaphobacter sp.]
MLALVVSFLVAVYLLGPNLVARFILGFIVPRKNLVQSRWEEFTRAVLWAAIPLVIAVFWAVKTGAIARVGQVADLETVFSGLYSERYFEAHQAEFFSSLLSFFWMNLALLLPLYSLVVGFSILLNFLILHYNSIRNTLKSTQMKTLLATIVLPRVSEWHVLLSDMLLPSKNLVLTADVLTKSNTLYQGRVQDKMLNPDGSLHSITLASPRRFLREQFQKAKDELPDTEIDEFWHNIPGNLFIVMGSDIVNLNLRYVQEVVFASEPSPEEVEVLKRLLARLTESK